MGQVAFFLGSGEGPNQPDADDAGADDVGADDDAGMAFGWALTKGLRK